MVFHRTQHKPMAEMARETSPFHSKPLDERNGLLPIADSFTTTRSPFCRAQFETPRIPDEPSEWTTRRYLLLANPKG
jgi:hypothetical protein